MRLLPISLQPLPFTLALLIVLTTAALSAEPASTASDPASTVRGTIEVIASDPGLLAEAEVSNEELEQAGNVDLAAALRELPGLDAVRRGPINLEPTVRGLQEGQLLLLADGTRTFAAGPGRMDSDLSHVNLHDVERVRIVKGPYALTWGPGALSAIELVTRRPQHRADVHRGAHATFAGRSNGDVGDLHASLMQSGPRLRWSVAGGARTGSDLETGDGTELPADFESRELSGTLGWTFASGLRFDLRGRNQRQDDIDYPGRMLDATFFETDSFAVEVAQDRAGAFVEEISLLAYVNEKSHAMNNDEKPSAMAMPGQMPPFGREILLPTFSDTTGARAFVRGSHAPWRFQTGGDWTLAEQSAVREIRRRDTGMLLFRDIVWPDAEVEDLGSYAQISRSFSNVEASGVVRWDRFEASAANLSEFFLATTGGPSQTDDDLFSAALSSRWRLDDQWTFSAGIGRVQRPVNATELYADRIPSTRFQISGEFLGNPALEPETSVELDLGLQSSTSRWTVALDGYWREMEDVVTFVARPDVPAHLPTTQFPVHQFVNGDRATAYGAEVKVRHSPSPRIRWNAFASWIHAQDETFDEPLLGMPPLTGRAALELRSLRGLWRSEIAITVADRQDRVAVSRGEIETPGWTRIDIRLGRHLGDRLDLELGIDNVADEAYAEHLNARNPFTGERILEPGRSLTARLAWSL